MHAESLGFTMHHAHEETCCPGCGNPASSHEHGLDCPYDTPDVPPNVILGAE